MGRWTANSTWKARTEGSGPHCTPVGVGTPTLPPRPLSAARAPSRQLPPFLPPRSQPRAPPQPRGPGRPGGCPHTHTSLPVPPAPPGAKARSRGGSRSAGVSRPSRGAGAPAGPPPAQAWPAVPSGEQEPRHVPSAPGCAFATGLGRAEPPKAQGGGGADRLREPCEGKEASVTGQRRSRSKQTPAACPERSSGSTPGWRRCGAASPHGAPGVAPCQAPTMAAGGWHLPEMVLFSSPRWPEQTDPGDLLQGYSEGSMPAGKRTQQFWECCWIFPYSPSGILAGGEKQPLLLPSSRLIPILLPQ